MSTFPVEPYTTRITGSVYLGPHQTILTLIELGFDPAEPLAVTITDIGENHRFALLVDGDIFEVSLRAEQGRADSPFHLQFYGKDYIRLTFGPPAKRLAVILHRNDIARFMAQVIRHRQEAPPLDIDSEFQRLLDGA